MEGLQAELEVCGSSLLKKRKERHCCDRCLVLVLTRGQVCTCSGCGLVFTDLIDRLRVLKGTCWIVQKPENSGKNKWSHPPQSFRCGRGFAGVKVEASDPVEEVWSGVAMSKSAGRPSRPLTDPAKDTDEDAQGLDFTFTPDLNTVQDNKWVR